MRARFVVPLFAILLAGCGGDRPTSVASAGKRPPSQPAQSSKPTRLEAQAEPSEAVWHLRAGLNVAALMCKGRGRVSVASPYAQLLKRHRDLLAAAHAAEERRHGAGFDRHMTGVYNRFANQRTPEAFCRKASDVAKEAVKMDSPTLAGEAKRLVGRLG